MNIAFHVAHASFLEDRVAWLAEFTKIAPFPFQVSESKEREHASVWAHRLWTQCAEQDMEDNGPEWHVLLNDDVDVHPNAKVFEAALSHAKSEIVALHTSATNRTDLRWITSYWATGPAYAIRRGVAQQLLQFQDLLPRDFFKIAGNNEDLVLIYYMWSKQDPCWSTIPALVQHRVDIKSAMGYDHHPLRQTPVPWTLPAFEGAKLDDPAFWATDVVPTFIENPWKPAAQIQNQWKLIKEAMLDKMGDKPSSIMCSFCIEQPLDYRSDKTGVGLCKYCLVRCIAGGLGLR